MLTNLTLIKQAPGPTRQGGQTPGQLAGVDPRLVAGGARDGGGGRKSSSGDQNSGSDHLRVAGAQPHPSRQAGGAEVERARRNRARGGGRSSGLVRVGARGHGRSHGWAHSAPGRVLSTLPCSGVSYGGSSTVCVIAGGEERSAPTARVVRGRGRARRERGNGQGLTVSSKRRSACSGRRWRRRINGDGGRSPRWKTTAMAMFRALPACVAHRR